jgi:ubiquinone/menaquinone biosynthesis C-methylase UbiE
MENDPYVSASKKYDWMAEPSARQLRVPGLTLFPPRENLKILDVACGTGNQLAMYDRAGCQLSGVERSPAMLEVARKKLGQRADLRLEDASQISFASGTFDLVMIALALHEMPAAVRPVVLRECRRVAKPDGRILIIDFHCGPYSFPRGWAQKLFLLMMEIGAGREHFANYRDFMRRRGLVGLIAEQNVPVVKRFMFATGIAAIFLLKP